MATVTDANADTLRNRSHGVIELQDDKGRRRTVQLDELSAADRELAEKFGYKPVSSTAAHNFF